MNTYHWAGALCLAFSALPAMAQEPAAPNRFVQDRFVIGLWVAPPMEENADERYKQINEAGLNLVIGGSSGDNASEQFALAEKYNLKILFYPGEMPVKEYPEGPACWGYALRDEPSAKDFPGLAEKVEAVRAHRPGRLAYINLFPSYASPWGQLGAENYDEYTRLFMEQVGTEVLCMDHYPIFKPDGDSRDGYCGDLDVMRKYSLIHKVPFWNFFNAMPYGPHTNPTESQMRWQVFASIAYGAKGVLYFCYWTPGFAPPNGEFPKGGALVAEDGALTQNWYKARRINEQLRNLGPTLMRLATTGVHRVKPDDNAAEALKGSPIADITRVEVDPPNNYLVGAFSHEDGRRAVLLMNYNFAYSAWPTVVFDAPIEQVVEVDKWSGKEIPVRDESPSMEGVQLPLEDGEGRLFLLPAK